MAVVLSERDGRRQQKRLSHQGRYVLFGELPVPGTGLARRDMAVGAGSGTLVAQELLPPNLPCRLLARVS